MRARFVSILILGLCLISVIVGLLTLSSQEKEKKACPEPSKTPILEKLSAGGNKIALITLHGVITYNMKSSFLGDVNSAEGALKALKKASKDKSVKGVIFRINSPGGTVAMSQEIHNSIMRLREKKPVVVSMADVAASGGYYVASAADRIYANPGSLTGSIGVIMETINARGLLTEKLGVESEIIKSGKYKDTGNIYRPLSNDERELLNNLINNAYIQFLNAIKEGRVAREDEYKLKKVELTEKKLKKYSDGRIFTGDQAVEYGFVDHLGGLAQAKDGVRQMAKEKFPFISDDIPVVDYNKPSGFSKFLLRLSNRFLPPLQ
ncbi:MAG: signal peptide peptidase SppA, partial [Candidatus Lokiarchaeota archaeon]|nr:signal peptide peptidase SppA [Candidatus Lokiarchaeota archaeon]